MKIIRFLVTGRKLTRMSNRFRIFILILLTVTFLAYLHLRLLPSSMGYYNEACYLNESQKTDMRYLLRHVSEAYADLNVTYWIDYGTLLGVVRLRDILPYDGDVDIGRLMTSLNEDMTIVYRFTLKMNKVGIKANAMTAKYKTAEADLFRWKRIENSTNGHTVLVKWYPFIPLESYIEKCYNYFFPPAIPVDVILPTREITLNDFSTHSPNRPSDLLKIRYPFTWFIKFPYKWKCWI